MSVEVKDVVKVYGSGETAVTALRGLNLYVEEGEIRAIVGPSGSGKTTLINIIGGIDRPSSGDVIVDGENLSLMKDHQLLKFRRKKVGIVFQFFNLIPTLTAYENVELPMILNNVPRQERKKRVMELLKMVGMEHRVNHKPTQLSGGEQQRVAIATALANNPRILLADEPTGELDTYNSRIIAKLFKEINRETGKTMIIVTHDISIATYARRISRLEDGIITATFTPAELQVELKAPKSVDEIVKNIESRISALEEEMHNLEEMFREGKITASEFVERYNELSKQRDELRRELKKYTLV